MERILYFLTNYFCKVTKIFPSFHFTESASKGGNRLSMGNWTEVAREQLLLTCHSRNAFVNVNQPRWQLWEVRNTAFIIRGLTKSELRWLVLHHTSQNWREKMNPGVLHPLYLLSLLSVSSRCTWEPPAIAVRVVLWCQLLQFYWRSRK